MIIDCHGHYTTAPPAHKAFREGQLAGLDPDPAEISDDEIREALSGNLCRCTGYDGIVRAVRSVAASGTAG